LKRLVIKAQKGFTLVEVIIAVALLAAVGVAFLSGMTTAFKSNIIADSKTNAAAIAQSQLEYLKDLPYQKAADGDTAAYDTLNGINENFTICSCNRDGDIIDGVIGIPVNTSTGEYLEEDGGIQIIKLIITQDDKVVYEVETYKVRQ
jgi:prepilin-type N-terminal cleavage/methylation domain-containing protein